jgi:translation initiation factor 2 beta subunit (eIF-2beta)/eIF-5
MTFEYDLNTMIDEAYTYLENEAKGEPLRLPVLDLEINTTRLHWKNVKTYLKTISRHPDHFMDFLKRELVGKDISWYSSSKADGLLIQGRFQKKEEITRMAIKYVENYVLCPSCKKSNTTLKKISGKKYVFECLDCGTKMTK